MYRIFALQLIAFLLFPAITIAQNSVDYYRTIVDEGEHPEVFVKNKLKAHDLIIFDDGLHAAVEPFDFITSYLARNPETINYLFLEVTPINVQHAIDSFMLSPVKDTSLLEEVFQNDYQYGWRYETYLKLFSEIWDMNQDLPDDKKIMVIGVNQPIYWEGLHTREDYNLFQESMIARDNFMYNIILKKLNYFNAGKKGFFLTNTRHAYKCIKNRDGQIYWNSGTFFHQWHPGKTYSIRFHNMILYIESEIREIKNSSTEGLDRLVYRWARMDNGLWDEAFAKNGNKPVAIPFRENLFGQHPYTGNHMADALPGQTMYDAYDALIFLKPLEETTFSAQTDFFYTDDFKKEVERRIRIIQGHQLDSFLEQNSFETIGAYVEKLVQPVPEKPNPTVN